LGVRDWECGARQRTRRCSGRRQSALLAVALLTKLPFRGLGLDRFVQSHGFLEGLSRAGPDFLAPLANLTKFFQKSGGFGRHERGQCWRQPSVQMVPAPGALPMTGDSTDASRLAWPRACCWFVWPKSAAGGNLSFIIRIAMATGAQTPALPLDNTHTTRLRVPCDRGCGSCRGNN